MDFMPDEKYSMVLSECWAGIFSFVFESRLFTGVAARAMAAKFFPAEVPMIVPKNIGPGADC